MRIMALLANIAIVVFELYTLWHLRKKTDVLKYYTYLQNLIALATSLVFSVFLIIDLASNCAIPEFAKGLRYVATCGLCATTLIFVLFLGAGKKVAMTENDFLPGCKPNVANIILHYICPILSLVSFVCFERNIELNNGIWTALVAIPSCAYWATYGVLSATKSWDEPYNFTSNEKKHAILDWLPFVAIPILFIALSFVLWNVK